MSWFQRKNHMQVEGRNVIITGGSQGMGKAAAILLSSMGANVAIVARNVEKLEAAMVEIKAAAKSHTQKFTFVSADLGDSKFALSAVQQIEAIFGITDILWACAGGSFPDFFKDTPPSIMEDMMRINYWSAAFTAHAVLNSMVDNPLPKGSPQRKIIFTSSLVTFSPIVGYAPYAGTKAALRALTDALRQECLLYDISVSCCFPGTIYTPGFDTESLTKPEICAVVEGVVDGLTPEAVVKACMKGLERGEVLVMDSFIGYFARGGMWGNTPKANLLLDTVMGWVTDLVWSGLGPYMDWQVRDYVKKNGIPASKGKVQREQAAASPGASA